MLSEQTQHPIRRILFAGSRVVLRDPSAAVDERWTSTCSPFVADGRAGLCRVAPNTAIDVASNRHEEAPGVRVLEKSRR
ncbi:hypothetical protein IscW_ISCW005397 [Ixodes scapularis]|uniref:Uncharacterized protein n=1 Tax=Ixodes scapularis TaxID=6945 RepID=B7PQ79_IXOSC|nr:hypothetical protein IscW_ISCW005397 [Ixodes scapularis]|eukprot:XP_002435921.1 hypothetical protein IscW_ISCW005397 [Ixodes scapularis]